MITPRIIAQRLPIRPSKDSHFTLKRRWVGSEELWWVHCDDLVADDAHQELAEAVNSLKAQFGEGPGGGFSINEHGQVIARANDPTGQANSAHIIGLDGRKVFTYKVPIIFGQGRFDPAATPPVGAPWPGPRAGSTYSLPAPGRRRPPSPNVDDVFLEVEGVVQVLSQEAGIDPYPPPSGPLAAFLAAARRLLPSGGRFRVNEQRRAFTSDANLFVGVVPDQWFPPLGPRA